MNYLKISSVFLAFLLIAGCNPNAIFSESETIEGSKWDNTKKIVFKPEIEDISKPYDICVTLSHVYGYAPKTLDIIVKTTSPSGIKKEKEYSLFVKSEDGAYYSDCAGDYCDLKTQIEKSFKFSEPGTWEFSIEHNMAMNPLPAVMEIGLVIEK
ncbi:MAG: hypothetical protein A2W91_11400 [Bacteroidetes bacterium GWF2_38_335]|nr:MAG: hypothetical protein A2W91_11400 [Bacteroidetes bacterium GWF2_38_335]OFY81698.1 MAG: hypothetical protein A2281_05645 [Bacteroidetes bacterium RIFOXYA12_FULL_38_20]HBS87762.1 hypothetical protein [Bacteroidales bacterium]